MKIIKKEDNVGICLLSALPLVVAIKVGIDEWQNVVNNGIFDWLYLLIGLIAIIAWSVPLFIIGLEFKKGN